MPQFAGRQLRQIQHDNFHALNCFANVDADQNPGYPCESNSPAALNVDAGGPFGDCNPDGVCDGNDAFHANRRVTMPGGHEFGPESEARGGTQRLIDDAISLGQLDQARPLAG